MSERALLQSLQVSRGIAATAVVLHHAAIRTDAFVGAAPAFSPWLKHGFLGVDFFFVLSGFIICHAHASDPPTFGAARAYVIKRLVRVFPAYLPISVLLMLSYLLLPGMSASGGRDYSIASSLFLWPASAPPALSVAWTLIHEMVFYAIFLAHFLARRAFPIILLVWSLGNLLAIAGPEPIGWTRYLLSPLNLEFLFGMLAALAIQRGLGRGVWPQVSVGTGLLITSLSVVMVGSGDVNVFRVVFGFGIAILVFGAARLDLRTPCRPSEILLRLGSASYAIYLVHNPLLSVTQRALARLPIGWPLSCAVGVGIALLAGLAYHRYVEAPALRWIRRRPLVGRLGAFAGPADASV